VNNPLNRFFARGSFQRLARASATSKPMLWRVAA
jgi:hypothetical protein